jgi:hypothetical protein
MERHEARIDVEEVEAALKRAADTALHGTPPERSGRFRPGLRKKGKSCTEWQASRGESATRRAKG